MKEDSRQTVLIYTGTSLIAKGLVYRLNEIGITPIEKNDMVSALRSGFAIGLNDQVRLFIRQDELNRAQNIIEQYLEEVGEEE